jgi:hypothetical protein
MHQPELHRRRRLGLTTNTGTGEITWLVADRPSQSGPQVIEDTGFDDMLPTPAFRLGQWRRFLGVAFWLLARTLPVRSIERTFAKPGIRKGANDLARFDRGSVAD